MNLEKRIIEKTNNRNIDMDTPYEAVKIELTAKCPLNCSFCVNESLQKNNKRQNFITEEDFDLVLSQIKTIPTIKEVGLFFMGESGFHPQLHHFAKTLKDNNYRTFLTTNAIYIDFIENAIPYIDSLKVSWNYKGLDDFMEKTKGTEFQYKTIIKNISTLYRECHLNNKCLAISTVLDSDEDKYKQNLKEENIPYDEHYFIPLQTQGGVITSGEDGCIGINGSTVSPIPCWTLFKCIYIDSELKVRLCTFGNHDYQIIGDLRKNTLVDIMNTDKVKNAKKAHLNHSIPDECKECLIKLSF